MPRGILYDRFVPASPLPHYLDHTVFDVRVLCTGLRQWGIPRRRLCVDGDGCHLRAFPQMCVCDLEGIIVL